eukprot:CAMPEP_0185744868 /NCGR_PEP_ID=MMETSP1174-20130828/3101_1 /TAXON_ID=35687 /ORGANISM="Dictyocha speculum, Strain CCMP1381" /LENGTH=50 /DNA_ID=CAMNT_0028418539 /DNA_START=26 /DNA_END=178 /DNA_ORIENTATION=-
MMLFEELQATDIPLVCCQRGEGMMSPQPVRLGSDVIPVRVSPPLVLEEEP